MYGKRKILAVLYALYIVFILMSAQSFLAEEYTRGQMVGDAYEAHLTFTEDGDVSHYVVQRHDTSSDGVIDVKYTPSTNKLEVTVSNIEELEIDCNSLYNEEAMNVLDIDPIVYPDYKQYFINQEMLIVTVNTNQLEPLSKLTLTDVPTPTSVKVEGEEWWEINTSYVFDEDDVTIYNIPTGAKHVEINFQEEDDEPEDDDAGSHPSEEPPEIDVFYIILIILIIIILLIVAVIVGRRRKAPPEVEEELKRKEGKLEKLPPTKKLEEEKTLNETPRNPCGLIDTKEEDEYECPDCSTDLIASDTFCPRCGVELE